ncbi:hypothetical protein BC939DRAFT_450068 [Gamsiella multidivaricata]|uniref:uncharacterized protein n=1 Tax=Gamsiella multidivaricata TaxID=101098 RepID=UPI00221FB1AA|nr:uncharacterized protein BC939DRAFT_450068 [Gamsiella multidivaricata]KAG0367422.1 hypothetical protein BGZ54_003879 [Gamsiella multidivaricata]KAI7824326.1 hypothetical protein BC939DRAFT_450068 [Gamsiella multidivaricata]
MKFATALLLIISYIAVASAHMAMLWPTPRGGFGTKQYNGRIHAFIGYKDNVWKVRFPCGGYAPGPITKMKAGQTINVRFYASGMRASDIKKQPVLTKSTKQFHQARHGGGMCEFSLSYDGGKTFHLIGRYTNTCPDAYFKWPVKIPSNVPSCTHDKCLFVWSWTANILPQYYMNCADIRLEGSKDGKLPSQSIQIVDFKNRKMNVKELGDGIKHRASTGPTKKEISGNLSGNIPKALKKA